MEHLHHQYGGDQGFGEHRLIFDVPQSPDTSTPKIDKNVDAKDNPASNVDDLKNKSDARVQNAAEKVQELYNAQNSAAAGEKVGKIGSNALKYAKGVLHATSMAAQQEKLEHPDGAKDKNAAEVRDTAERWKDSVQKWSKGVDTWTAQKAADKAKAAKQIQDVKDVIKANEPGAELPKDVKKEDVSKKDGQDKVDPAKKGEPKKPDTNEKTAEKPKDVETFGDVTVHRGILRNNVLSVVTLDSTTGNKPKENGWIWRMRENVSNKAYAALHALQLLWKKESLKILDLPKGEQQREAKKEAARQYTQALKEYDILSYDPDGPDIISSDLAYVLPGEPKPNIAEQKPGDSKNDTKKSDGKSGEKTSDGKGSAEGKDGGKDAVAKDKAGEGKDGKQREGDNKGKKDETPPPSRGEGKPDRKPGTQPEKPAEKDKASVMAAKTTQELAKGPPNPNGPDAANKPGEKPKNQGELHSQKMTEAMDKLKEARRTNDKDAAFAASVELLAAAFAYLRGAINGANSQPLEKSDKLEDKGDGKKDDSKDKKPDVPTTPRDKIIKELEDTKGGKSEKGKEQDLSQRMDALKGEKLAKIKENKTAIEAKDVSIDRLKKDIEKTIDSKADAEKKLNAEEAKPDGERSAEIIKHLQDEIALFTKLIGEKQKSMKQYVADKDELIKKNKALSAEVQEIDTMKNDVGAAVKRINEKLNGLKLPGSDKPLQVEMQSDGKFALTGLTPEIAKKLESYVDSVEKDGKVIVKADAKSLDTVIMTLMAIPVLKMEPTAPEKPKEEIPSANDALFGEVRISKDGREWQKVYSPKGAEWQSIQKEGLSEVWNDTQMDAQTKSIRNSPNQILDAKTIKGSAKDAPRWSHWKDAEGQIWTKVGTNEWRLNSKKETSEWKYDDMMDTHMKGSDKTTKKEEEKPEQKAIDEQARSKAYKDEYDKVVKAYDIADAGLVDRVNASKNNYEHQQAEMNKLRVFEQQVAKVSGKWKKMQATLQEESDANGSALRALNKLRGKQNEIINGLPKPDSISDKEKYSKEVRKVSKEKVDLIQKIRKEAVDPNYASNDAGMKGQPSGNVVTKVVSGPFKFLARTFSKRDSNLG